MNLSHIIVIFRDFLESWRCKMGRIFLFGGVSDHFVLVPNLFSARSVMLPT